MREVSDYISSRGESSTGATATPGQIQPVDVTECTVALLQATTSAVSLPLLIHPSSHHVHSTHPRTNTYLSNKEPFQIIPLILSSAINRIFSSSSRLPRLSPRHVGRRRQQSIWLLCPPRLEFLRCWRPCLSRCMYVCFCILEFVHLAANSSAC